MKMDSDNHASGSETKQVYFRPTKVGAGFVAAVAFVLIGALVPSRFGANDDNGVINLLTNYPNDPGHNSVPALSRLMQSVLVMLYDWTPHVPWYGVLLLATLTIGLTLWFAWFFRLSRSQQILAGPAVFLVASYLVTRPTFTAATLSPELAGFLTLYDLLRSNERFRFPGWLVFFSIVVASFWRVQLFVVVLAFGVPVFLAVSKMMWRQIAIVPAAIAVGLAAVFAAGFADGNPSAESEAFAAYTRARAAFHDTQASSPDSPTFERALDAAGWTLADYNCYSRWMLYDSDRFNEDSLKRFLSVNTSLASVSTLDKLWLTFVSFSRMNFLYLFVVFLTIFVGAFLYRPPWSWQSFSYWVCLAIVTAGLLMLLGIRCPSRVCIPLLLYVLAIAIPTRRLLPDVPSQLGRLAQSGSIAAVMCVCIVAGGWRIVSDLADASSGLDRLAYIDRSMRAARGYFEDDALFVMLNPHFGTGGGWRQPLTTRRDWESMKIVPSGWSTHSPKFSATLNSVGLANGSEMVRRSIGDDRVVYFGYYIGDGTDPRFEFWEQPLEYWDEFLAERYSDPGSGTVPRLVNEFDCRVPTLISHQGGVATPSVEGLVFFTVKTVSENESDELASPLEQDALNVPRELVQLESVHYLP